MAACRRKLRRRSTNVVCYEAGPGTGLVRRATLQIGHQRYPRSVPVTLQAADASAARSARHAARAYLRGVKLNLILRPVTRRSTITLAKRIGIVNFAEKKMGSEISQALALGARHDPSDAQAPGDRAELGSKAPSGRSPGLTQPSGR